MAQSGQRVRRATPVYEHLTILDRHRSATGPLTPFLSGGWAPMLISQAVASPTWAVTAPGREHGRCAVGAADADA